MNGTYIITKGLAEEVLSMTDCITIIEDVFKQYGMGEVQMPPKLYLDFGKGDLRCMPAYIPSLNIAGIKSVNVHPENRGLPSVMAVIMLTDPDTGYPLAIMDGTYITRMRTGAAGGVAAKYLSMENAETAAFIGAGEQAKTQFEALTVVRQIRKVIVFDLDNRKSRDFVSYASGFGINTELSDSVENTVAYADIIITTTPSRSPLIYPGHVRKGTHINAIGADAKGKQELDHGLLKISRIVIDNREQASHSGEINTALSSGAISIVVKS